jgi:hypothetical protein
VALLGVAGPLIMGAMCVQDLLLSLVGREGQRLRVLHMCPCSPAGK